MKKLALLVMTLVVLGLGASSCGKDKSCKCTYAYSDGTTESQQLFPEEYNASSCANLQEKVNMQIFEQGVKFTCVKM